MFHVYTFNVDTPVKVSGQQVLNIQLSMQHFQYAFSLITENMET